MPRTRVEVEGHVECLSILDEHGALDAALAPELEPELLLRMYDAMLLARRFDDEMLSLQRQGRLGTFAPVRGQEAAQIGSAAALAADDWVVPSYRETAVAIWRGLPLEGLLLFNAGYNEGGAIPEGRNQLPVSVPVGSQMLHAAGIAYALRLQGKEQVALTYFGDGATSEGDFHEALNFAAVLDCPCVFVCQNNQYAISVPREKQTRSRTLAQKAFAYGLPGLQVDGNDVLAVHVATREAVARAREEHRATLIECLTYRLGVHTTVDDPSKYRDDAEVEAWQARDPLPRFQAHLVAQGVLDERRIGHAEGAAEGAVRAARERWQEAMAEAETAGAATMFDHIYAEPTRELAAQRRAMALAPPPERVADADEENGADEEREDEKAEATEDEEAAEETADVGEGEAERKGGEVPEAEDDDG